MRIYSGLCRLTALGARWVWARTLAEVTNEDGVSVLNDAVLAVPLHGTGEHGALDLSAQGGELRDSVLVRDGHNVLFDDGPSVELGRHVVRGRAEARRGFSDEFHFSRRFKSLTGYTPSEWRAAIG